MLTSDFFYGNFQNMNSTHYNPNKLAKFRKQKLTQRQLAEKLGVAEMTITRAEKGTSVSYELLSDICKEIGVDIKEILISTPAKNFSAVT